MEAKKVYENIFLKDIPGNCIWKRNFSGRKEPMNEDGNRQFLLSLDPEYAKELEDKGWNVKWPKPEQEDKLPFLPVFMRFDKFPPEITMTNGVSKQVMDDVTINRLDRAYIKSVPILLISPYNWEMHGRTGVKAMVKKMLVIIEKDAEDDYNEEYNRFFGSDIDDEEVPFN